MKAGSDGELKWLLDTLGLSSVRQWSQLSVVGPDQANNDLQLKTVICEAANKTLRVENQNVFLAVCLSECLQCWERTENISHSVFLWAERITVNF